MFGSNNSLGSALGLCAIYMRQCHHSFFLFTQFASSLSLCPVSVIIHCRSNCLLKMLSFGNVTHDCSIKNDDKMIQAEGVESLSEEELRQACRERGLLGLLSTEEMRQQVISLMLMICP